MSIAEVFPEGYGGVILGIYSSLNNHQIDVKTDAEFIAAKISNGRQTVILSSLYRPTKNKVEEIDALKSAILHLCQINLNASIWISGDISLPDIDWTTSNVISHQHRKCINDSFLHVLKIAGLEQLIDISYQSRQHSGYPDHQSTIFGKQMLSFTKTE